MVAYSFQPRFEVPIKLLQKTGTIRAEGKRRHARPGDALQLYTGMRTKSCRLLARAVCVANHRITINFEDCYYDLGESPFRFIAPSTEIFAREDGFLNWNDMAAFWLKTQGVKVFSGRYITWLPESVQVAP